MIASLWGRQVPTHIKHGWNTAWICTMGLWVYTTRLIWKSSNRESREETDHSGVK